MILPYIDQGPLYNRANFSSCFGCLSSPGNPSYEIVSVAIPGMTCPSDIEVELSSPGYRRGNYAANTGVGAFRSVETPRDATRAINGPFTMNSKTRMADFMDGSSNTILISELLKVPGNDWRGVMHYPEGPLYQHDQTPNSPVQDQLRTGNCVSIPRAPCTGVYSAWNNRAIVMAARSVHTGGVHSLLGDGTVRFISQNLNATIWQGLSSMDGGEPLGDF